MSDFQRNFMRGGLSIIMTIALVALGAWGGWTVITAADLSDADKVEIGMLGFVILLLLRRPE